MKSIGETLKEAREAKGSTIQQISLDLNISREYLVALEEEQFDIFPAETYLLGFLRNYSEYLGLDVEKNIGLYKNYKISEEPAPLEELVGQKKTPAVLPLRLIFIVLLLGALTAAGWFGYQYFSPRFMQEEVPVEVYKAVDYSLDQNSAEWQMKTGDRILVPHGNGELVMRISIEDRRCRIAISDLADEDLILFPGDEKILPGGGGIPVIRLKLNSLDESVALLLVERTDVITENNPEIKADELIPPVAGIAEDAEKTILAGLSHPEDFTFNAQFSSYCLFRYQADGAEAVEKYYRDGDRIRLDVEKQLMIWGSSAGAVSLSVNGVNVAQGKSGEVIVKLIQWVKNDEGKYDLVLFPVQ